MTKKAPASLKPVFKERAKRPAHLEQLLERLEQLDLRDIPDEERSKAVQFLTRSLFSEADQENFWYTSPENKEQYLHEPPFAQEIKHLLRLLDSLALSAEAHQWALDRTQALAETLKRVAPYRDTERQWSGLNMTEKKEKLAVVNRLQCEIFKEGAINFIPAEIKFDATTRYNGFIRPRPVDLELKTIVPIHINETRVREGTYAQCSQTVVHEQLHGMFAQLAIAERHGLIPREHPLKKDAARLLARHKYFGYGTALIKSAYDRDPEECVTFSCHRAFNKHYTQPERHRGLWQNIKHWAQKLGL